MKLSFRPMAWIKTLAVSASVVTMCTSPLALGAEAQNQKQLVNEYLKATGWGAKDMTVGEFWAKVRHTYPEAVRRDVDLWVGLNRHQLMPKIDVATYRDRNGQEQLRVSFSRDGQVVTLTNTGDDDANIKINNVTISKKEMFNHKIVAKKMAEQDPTIKKALKTGKLPSLGKNVVMTYKEYSRLTARQKAEYLVRLRYAMEAAQRVFTAKYGQQAMNDFNQQHQFASNWAAELFFGAEAFAQAKKGQGSLTGKACIVAGYLSVYGENQSCGGSKKGADDLARKMESGGATCSGNAVACNPMVYGFDGAGGAHCVPRGEVKYATRICNQKSPLRTNGSIQDEAEDKKRIIESYLKKVKGQEINLVLNKEGKISQEQLTQISAYLGDLDLYINSAIAECDGEAHQKIQKAREDQVSACNEIRVRAFSLQAFVVEPQPAPPRIPAQPAPGQIPQCELDIVGSLPSEDGRTCVCPEGTQEGDFHGPKDEVYEGREQKMCSPLGAVAEEGLAGGKGSPIKGEVVDSCGFWCKNKNWLIPGGIFLGILWILSLFNKKPKTKTPPTAVPPITVVPSPSPSPTLTPAPTLPPAPTCNAPNMWVGGVCTPPAITPVPPPPPSEGGVKPDNNNTGGGVR